MIAELIFFFNRAAYFVKYKQDKGNKSKTVIILHCVFFCFEKHVKVEQCLKGKQTHFKFEE